MQQEKKLNFIDGTFSPKESREILMSVFSSKIHFHETKNFSSRERFGIDDKTAIKRIPALTKTMEELLNIIDAAQRNGEQLQVKSDICISLIKTESEVSSEAMQA